MGAGFFQLRQFNQREHEVVLDVQLFLSVSGINGAKRFLVFAGGFRMPAFLCKATPQHPGAVDLQFRIILRKLERSHGILVIAKFILNATEVRLHLAVGWVLLDALAEDLAFQFQELGTRRIMGHLQL